MITEKQISKLEGLGFDIVKRDEDHQGEFLNLELKATKQQFIELLPNEFDHQDVVATVDSPTFGRVRPLPIYSNG